jgi:hypothetical protein
MAPYLDALIGKLLALLQRGRRNVQEGALTALAAVADTAEVGGCRDAGQWWRRRHGLAGWLSPCTGVNRVGNLGVAPGNLAAWSSMSLFPWIRPHLVLRRRCTAPSTACTAGVLCQVLRLVHAPHDKHPHTRIRWVVGVRNLRVAIAALWCKACCLAAACCLTLPINCHSCAACCACPPPTAGAGKEMQLLRAKALECVSLVGLAVGKERFG